MAVVGDLFVNVRARTGGLTKGLRRARQKMQTFGKSAGGIITGLAAGFGLFKLGSAAMSALVFHSKDFGEAWARVHNTVNELFKSLAEKIGPVLADGLNSLADWLENSSYIHDLFEGLAHVLQDAVVPAIRWLFDKMEAGADKLAEWITLLTGVRKESDRIGKGFTSVDAVQNDAIARGEISKNRRGIIMAQANAQFAAGNSTRGEELLRQIRDRIEVPR